MNTNKKIRILMAKVGLDGHDKGVLLISSILRDAGMEVIYTGLRRTPAECVNTAIQEDVDIIGISILSDAHMSIAKKMVALMKENEIEDKPLLMGGVIPDEDITKLKEIGVAGVFTQSSTYEEMINFIHSAIKN